MLEIELNESLRRRRNELNAKIDSLGEAESGDSSAIEELEKKRRELDALNKSIESLTKKIQGEPVMAMSSTQLTYSIEMEKEQERLQTQLQESRASLERLQNQQAEDNRDVSKQQKNTERYLAKKTMLMTRKEECNRNIRDLGVLPEEAFEKYTSEKMDRVSTVITQLAY